MIHYPNNNEEIELRRDGCEGEDPIVVGESSDTPLSLLSVPRWNKDNAVVERHYEIYNAYTGVVEARLRTNFMTAASVFESIAKLWLDLNKHGTVEAFNEAEDDEPAIPTPTIQ